MTKSSRPTFGRLLRSLLATSALVVAAQTASVHAGERRPDPHHRELAQ